MKWLSKKIETALLFCSFIVGLCLILAFFIEGHPMMILGVVLMGVSEVRLIELWLFDFLNADLSGVVKRFFQKLKKDFFNWKRTIGLILVVASIWLLFHLFAYPSMTVIVGMIVVAVVSCLMVLFGVFESKV